MPKSRPDFTETFKIDTVKMNTVFEVLRNYMSEPDETKREAIGTEYIRLKSFLTGDEEYLFDMLVKYTYLTGRKDMMNDVGKQFGVV